MNELLKLVAAMGKEAFVEWRRGLTDAGVDNVGNMLMLLDAVGEGEFRQMAQQKYLGVAPPAPIPALNRRHSSQGERPARGVQLTEVHRFELRPIEAIPRVVVKEEDHGADLANGHDGGPSTALQPYTTKKHWTDAEITALSNWLEEEKRSHVAGRLTGARSMAPRAKEALGEQLATRSTLSIEAMIRRIRTGEFTETAHVGGEGARKQPRRHAKKTAVGVGGRGCRQKRRSGALVPAPSARRPPTPVPQRSPTKRSRADLWSTEEERSLINWFNANTVGDERIVLLHVATRAQRELLPDRSVRSIETRLCKLRRDGATVKSPAKPKPVGEKGVQWSPMQKALLARWIDQNVEDGTAMDSSAAVIPLAQRAKDDLGDELHDRSAMAIANAIMKIKSFGTKATLDEWVKRDGF